ncbi:YueI family protein [Alkaliphilus pronyensis]|uniref:YueI family protein n=1 Tax=Alkaliphilus pronyensis TaxID=1482732 RepID=A0A6I0FLY8_9FIRM|nr:YueI family protein [Alkaliphilus pronyensis]KAB3539699.1 YueI family protein [Alkaliphilus pronyensis]
MSEKDELRKTVEIALNGTPQIKREEKVKWLGEFRERVIMGLTVEDAKLLEGLLSTEQALEDPCAEMLIVNNKVPMEIMGKYMQLAKRKNKEYKTVNTDSAKAMGIVVASRSPVNRKNVQQAIVKLPEKFRNLKYKGLCEDCFKEIESISKKYAKSFKKISIVDKLLGIKCSACHTEKDDGPLM